MKKFIIYLLAAFIIFPAAAQDKTKTVKSKIKAVTVFLSGAQVMHTAESSLAAGSTTLVFGDLTSNINPQSIQVKGEGDFSILSVTHQLNYLRSKELTDEIKNLQDSLNLLQKEIDYQNALLSVYNDEEALVLANKQLAGDNTGVKATDIKDAADFYRTRLTEIRTTKLNIAAKVKKHTDRWYILNNQLSTLNASQNEPSGEIVVIVSAEAALTAKFTIQYLVTNAGWVPSYDLRAVDVNNPIELVYKANVWQTTGRDWENVDLTLCTGNPTQTGTRPIISPWYLSFYQPYTYSYDRTTREESNAPSSAAGSADIGGYEKEAAKTKTAADYTVVNENQTNIEYDISVPYTIPADGKYKIVEIQKNSLPAQYEYFAAPKLDPDAFLVARVSGWEQYNLIPGEANLFFEGTYLGKSYIDPRYTKDTLEISLGRDKSISITREKLKDFSSTKLIGTNTKETFTFEITVRNKKKAAVSFVLEDQIPVSTDKDIVVELLESSGAQLDEASGKLTWKLELKPSETKTFRLSFSVKYPKDKQVNLFNL